jgi:hypothetical protein
VNFGKEKKDHERRKRRQAEKRRGLEKVSQ